MLTLWPCRDHSMESLQKRFGESTGAFLYNICRGIDHEEGNIRSTWTELDM